MKMEKRHLHHLKLRNFMKIQILKKTKNNSLRFLKLHIMNLKMQYPPNQLKDLFFAMKIIKNKLRYKMEAEFLASTMVIYIERDITTNFISDSIIEDLKSLKECRGAL